MEPKDELIKSLTEEIEALKAEIEKSKEREKDFDETRKAMLYLLEDVNESKEEITRAKETWEATFDSISHLLFIHDRDMNVVRCNNAYRLAAGLKFKEIIGRPYYEIFPKMDGPFEMCRKKVKSEDKHEEEEEVFVSSVNRIYKIKFFMLKSSESEDESYIHIMEDITEAKRSEERFRVLYEFGQKIAMNLDFGFRLRFICETAAGFGYKLAWIGIPDEATREVVPKAYAGEENGYLSEIKVMYDDSPLAKSPVGKALKSKVVEIQDDIHLAPEFGPWREQVVKRGFRSSASFPIIDGERVIACLNLYTSEDKFPRADLPFLMSFASSAATYIKNAKLFAELHDSTDRIRTEMEVTKNLLKIAESTARTTDIEKLMEQVVKSLREVMKCNACVAYLWDGQNRSFQPLQEVGLARESVPFFRVEHLEANNAHVITVFEGRGPVIAKFDSEAAPDYAALRSNIFPNLVKGLKTAVLIPVIGREDYLGLIVCLYAGAGAAEIKERYMRLLSGITHQVSIALEEARLFKDSIDKTMELSRKIETIQAMSEIDMAILSTLKPVEILETATMMIGKIINCERATIALIDMDRGGFIYTAGFGVTSIKKGDLVPFEKTCTTEVLKNGRPQYIANAGEVKNLLPLESNFLKEGFLTHLRVPMTVKGEVMGILSVGAKRPSAFTSDDLSTVEKLAAQIGVALDNARLFTDREELFIGVVKTLSEAIDAKSPWTRGHSERVTKLAIEIGTAMGLSEVELKELELAGLLHDIGKLGTYEAILDKPGRLTEDEIKIMRQHPKKGAEILSPIKQLKHILPAIHFHHEYFDGTGYPDGLKGEDIPFMARILTVADTIDAMGADRPYRKGRSMEKIVAELKRCSGTQFDPRVVEVFLDVLQKKGFGGIAV